MQQSHEDSLSAPSAEVQMIVQDVPRVSFGAQPVVSLCSLVFPIVPQPETEVFLGGRFLVLWSHLHKHTDILTVYLVNEGGTTLEMSLYIGQKKTEVRRRNTI